MKVTVMIVIAQCDAHQQQSIQGPRVVTVVFRFLNRYTTEEGRFYPIDANFVGSCSRCSM